MKLAYNNEEPNTDAKITSLANPINFLMIFELNIAKKSNVWSHKNNIPKLRDTKIDKYNETINDYRFIPIAFRMKINQQTGEVITFNERGIKPDYSLYNNDK